MISMKDTDSCILGVEDVVSRYSAWLHLAASRADCRGLRDRGRIFGPVHNRKINIGTIVIVPSARMSGMRNP